MKIVHLLRAGIVALALLVVPVAGTATAHSAPAQQAEDAGRDRNTDDTPWGP